MTSDPHRPPIRWAPVAGVLLLILFATLGRTELPPPGVRNVDWCFSCGSQWGIDFVLNIVLFVPLGLALRLAGAARRRSAAIVFLTTLAIELVQLAIPGRITSTGDLLANTVGGVAGYELAGHLLTILAPAGRQARGFLVAAGAAVPALFAVTLWLFEPAPTEQAYWGQFAPTLGQFAQFRGRVLRARVGGEPLRNGRLPNTDAVRALLAEDGTRVEAVVEPGPPTAALAPAVSIFDRGHNEVMLLGRDGDDLVFRLRTRAMRLGLRTPSVTVWGAYRLPTTAGEGRTVRLAGWVRGYAISAEARADTGCVSRTIDFRPTQGWAFVLPFEHLYTPRAPRFTLLWVALLFAPLGYYAAVAAARFASVTERVATGAWIAITAAAALWGVPAAAGLSSGTRWEWQGAAAGIVAGAVLAMLTGVLLRRRVPPRGAGAPEAAAPGE